MAQSRVTDSEKCPSALWGQELPCKPLPAPKSTWGEAQGEQEPEDTGFRQVAGRGHEPW